MVEKKSGIFGIITASHCVHCKTAKLILGAELRSGKIKELPVEDPKWLAFARKHKISGVPSVVLMSSLDPEAKLLKKCSLAEFQKTGSCKPEEEEKE